MLGIFGGVRTAVEFCILLIFDCTPDALVCILFSRIAVSVAGYVLIMVGWVCCVCYCWYCWCCWCSWCIRRSSAHIQHETYRSKMYVNVFSWALYTCLPGSFHSYCVSGASRISIFFVENVFSASNILYEHPFRMHIWTGLNFHTQPGICVLRPRSGNIWAPWLSFSPCENWIRNH